MESERVMPDAKQGDKAHFQLFLIGLLALATGAAFLGLIWDYLIALFLAAVFSAMSAPLYRWIYERTGHSKGVAVGITLILLSVGVLLPLGAVIVLGVQQAAGVAQTTSVWLETVDIGAIEKALPGWLPFEVDVAGLGATIAQKVGQAAGQIADFFVTALSQVTRGTVTFFLNIFIMLYAMVFFLPQTSNMFQQMLIHSGLPSDVQHKLADRVVSISRATIKGTFLIGVAQGVLGGLGFWIAGLPGAAFWGCVMAVFSVIPGIGPTLVLIPGIIVLVANGHLVAAAGLAIWTGLVVTTVDNLLRPILVGRDTRMPDLLVLISTFGGLATFGAVGLVVGPVIAGLFLTVWAVFEQSLRTRGLAEEATADAAISDTASAKPDTAQPEQTHLARELETLRADLDVLKKQR
ncbi:AI-2E family transporter [uncultured Roseibium sp.]|uniref:AI-2E family transporter n=1 Tax=uncultured Roseibium sp. TaxID=1936171 RepID=UPI00262FD441|nr:AI-2E family transporter [uncultured Roseibium sp.]